MKLNRLVVCLSSILLLFSCKGLVEPQGELITVKLSPSFITMSEGTDVQLKVKSNSVKMRTADLNQVVYAIQIYENDSAYYAGLFDSVDSMKMVFTTGKTYRFKIATYKTTTGKELKIDLESGKKYYYLPNKTLLGNKFLKGNALKDINLISSTKFTHGEKEYPEIDMFYCEKTVSVEKGLTELNFSLIRMGFGVNFTVDGLTNGKLNIIMGDDTTVLNSATTNASSIRLFKVPTGDLSTVFKAYSGYADSIPVNVQWVGTNGTILNTFGIFNFARNYSKTINIQLNTANLKFGFEDWVNVVTDMDGNIYHTITIGTQVWMVENLRVTKYNDGVSIPNVTSGYDWGGLTTPAYCWYDNHLANKNSYGAMYNWHAVNSNKLAPQGWHIPSNDEWAVLTDYLGGLSASSNKLKESGSWHWGELNTGATNESKFTALPGGYRRFSDGVFFSKGSNCSFWSSTANNDLEAWSRAITLYDANDSHDVQVVSNLKNYGISVRCIKD